MFNPIFTDPNNSLLKDRLARAQQVLRGQSFPTREEYQAAVFSAVNGILELGPQMTPLTPIAGEGPAVVGDLTNNFLSLNNDASDIAAELLRLEDSAGSLYNLAAATQNSLRQQIREQIYSNSGRRYLEDFLSSSNLAAGTATVDYAAGEAMLPLVGETKLSPTIAIGLNSVGSASVGVSALTDNAVDTAMVWNGTTLELILSFPSAQVVNRLILEMDDYEGLEISSFTSSPDGTLTEDIRAGLQVDSLLLNCASGKYSGAVVLDFPPKQALQVRILIQDLVGKAVIALRSLSVYQRSYSPSAVLTSQPINNPAGTVRFNATQVINGPYTSITHQISYDGVSFVAVRPGTLIVLNQAPYWYRAVLERSASAFSQSTPLANPGYDPAQSSNYTLSGTSSIPLGNGIVEKTLSIDDVTGPIYLADVPLPGTLRVQEGSVILPSSAYAFNGGTLSFPSPVTGIIVTYQTSSLGPAAISALETFYTPLLYEFRFDKV